MRVFLVDVRDRNFCQQLPDRLRPNGSDRSRVKMMAFPPLGIQTLAPVLRQRGHQVRMFDTCHPQMKAEHIAQAVAREQPDVIALSFLSTTTYPAAKRHGPATQGARRRRYPIIVGGAFASIECGPHPRRTARTSTVSGWARARNCCRTTWTTSTTLAPWRAWSGVAARKIVRNAPRPLLATWTVSVSRPDQSADRLH